MRRWLIRLPIVFGVLGAALVIATAQLSHPKFEGHLEGDPIDRVVIAPPLDAVTLARLRGDAPRVVLIRGRGAGRLEAVDLERYFGRSFSDAIDAWTSLGRDALLRAADLGESAPVDYADLGLPFDAPAIQIAAGTNFASHAEEVGREDGPFLFPKLAQPTAWDADVPDHPRLDYEAEICAVTLSAHREDAPAPLGFVACNDFTDRLTLVKQMDLGEPMGVTGFPDGKGGPGMLPIGPLLVIPVDSAGFHDALELDLWVDTELRQQARGGLMIWTPAEIVSRAFAACDVVYRSAEGDLPLTSCEAIPAGTLVLTGTPAGVLFHPITLWTKYAYLGPGDEVVMAITHLGVLKNRVR